MKKAIVNHTIKNSNPTVWLVPILIIGGLLRYYNNTALALWHDEAFSALYIRYSWTEMMHRIGLDVHPPLYYWILRLYSYIFGSGLLSLRSLSILFGILTIYAGYLFVKEAFKNERLAILAAFLLAINPFQIQYSLEARMYTLGTFLVLLSSYYLIKALKSDKWQDWLIYAILVSAQFYTHYYLFFSIAAQGLFFLYYIWKEKQWKIKGWIAYGLSIILFFPWIPVLLAQIQRVEKAYWIPAPDRWSVPATIWKMLFGGQGNDHLTLTLATIAAIIIFYFFFREKTQNSRWFIASGLFIPFIAAFLLSFRQAIYLDRYFVFASLYFTILIAAVIYNAPKYTQQKILTIAFAAFSIFIFLKNWRDLGPIRQKPGMAAASSFVNEIARKEDKIYVGSSFVYFTFKYYNQTGIAPLLYSSGPLESIPHFSGTALLTNDDLILDFKPAPKNSIVWLIWTTGFGGGKPNVPGNWSKVDEKEWSDTPGFKGNIIVTEYHVN